MRLHIKDNSAWDSFKTRLGLLSFEISQANVTKTFKAVESDIHNVNGGVGDLQTALDDVEQRVKNVEEKRREKVEKTGSQLFNFLSEFKKTDKRLAEAIKLENQKFYEINPWAVPPPPPKKKKWYEKAWDAIKGAFKAVGKAIKKAVDWVKDTVKKVWNKTVAFIKKHWKAIVKIVVGAVIIAGLAALSVFTGGAAAPLFAVAAKAAAVSALTSTAITVVSGAAQGKSFGEIFDSAADSFMIGSITGAVSGFAGAAAGAVTSATGSQVLGKLTELGINTAGKLVANGASYLIDNGNLKGYMDAKGYDILKEAGMSALSIGGDYLKGKGMDLLKDKFGGLTQNQLVNSLGKAYDYCKEKAPALTNIVTNTAKDVAGSLSWSDLGKLKNPSSFAKELGSRALGSLASNAKGEIGNFINNDLNNMTGGAIKDVMNSVADSDFGKSVSDIYGKANDLIGGVKNTIGDAAGSLGGQFKDVIGHISGEFKSVIGGTAMDNIGRVTKIVGGLDSTIGNKVGEVTGQLGSSLGIKMDNISGVTGSLGSILNSVTSRPEQTISHVLSGAGTKNISSICSSSFAGTLSSAVNSMSKTTTFASSTTSTVSSFLSSIRL